MAKSNEAAVLLSELLPVALGRLVELTGSRDRWVARKAAELLAGYLSGPHAIQATVAVGTAEAAEMHLQALNDLQAMRARLGPVRGHACTSA